MKEGTGSMLHHEQSSVMFSYSGVRGAVAY